MGCPANFVRVLLLIGNVIFALAGLALLGLGVAVILVLGATGLLDSSDLALARALAVAVLCAGPAIFLVACVGCCGSVALKNSVLITYAVALVVLMVFKVAVAALVFVNLRPFIAQAGTALAAAFTPENMQYYHAIETGLSCCGVSGPGDYNSTALPESCCSAAPCSAVAAHGGCSAAVVTWSLRYGLSIGYVALIASAAELIAVMFALCLANHVRTRKRMYY